MFRLIIAIIIISLPSIGSLVVPGYYGASDDLHIAWLQQFDRTIIDDGQIPPRYVPDLSYGFGYPLFHFTYPFPFALAESFHLIGANFVDSIKITFALSLVLSSLGTVLLVSKLGMSRGASFLAGILYLYAPYRATDIYIRGAFGESLALAIIPWLILVTLSKSTLKSVAGIGLLSALLITTHNITAYLFIPLVLIYLLLQRKFKVAFLGLGLGLLISSFFWVPAIIDSQLMIKDTVFNPLDHFPTLRQLITPFWGYGASVPGPYDGMSFYQGTFQLILGILGSVFLLRSNKKPIYIWAILCLLISLFLMNFRSSVLWTTIPLLGYVQFPWRLQFLTLLALVLLSLPLLSKLPNKVILLLSVVVLSVNIFMFAPHDQLGRTDEYFLNRYIPVPSASFAYTQTQEEYLRLPLGVQKRPNENLPLVEVPEGVDSQLISSSRPLEFTVRSVSETPFVLTVNRYNFPGWEARDANYNNLKISTGNPHGQLEIPVSAGNQSTSIKFTQTLRNQLFNLISLVGFILAILLIII